MQTFSGISYYLYETNIDIFMSRRLQRAFPRAENGGFILHIIAICTKYCWKICRNLIISNTAKNVMECNVSKDLMKQV